MARLHADQTIGEALAALRQSPPPARIVYFYVVDDQQRLQGVIPARTLLLSPPETPIAQIMLRSVIAIPSEATVLDACEFFVLHRFLAFPVIDAERRLIGAIDVELYTDELRDLGGGLNDDLFQLIGVHLAWARQLNPLGAFRRRFPWLMCNITGGVAAAFLCGLFQAEIQRAVSLALFIPVVLALAESVSIQSISLTLQVLHGRPPSWLLIFQKLHRELLVGLLLGGASGLVVGLVALALARSMAIGRLRAGRHRGRCGQRGRVGGHRAQSVPPPEARSAGCRRPRRAGLDRRHHVGLLLQPRPVAAGLTTSSIFPASAGHLAGTWPA